MITQSRPRTENADRERYLHRAATAACRRHEISIAQLNEISRTGAGTRGCTRWRRRPRSRNAIRDLPLRSWQEACAGNGGLADRRDRSRRAALPARRGRRPRRSPNRSATSEASLVGRAVGHRRAADSVDSGQPSPDSGLTGIVRPRVRAPSGYRHQGHRPRTGRRRGWRSTRRVPPPAVRLHRAARIEDALHEIVERRLRQPRLAPGHHRLHRIRLAGLGPGDGPGRADPPAAATAGAGEGPRLAQLHHLAGAQRDRPHPDRRPGHRDPHRPQRLRRLRGQGRAASRLGQGAADHRRRRAGRGAGPGGRPGVHVRRRSPTSTTR